MIGTVIAGYRITGTLGAGAMGKVYRAEDVESGTPVAFKVLHGFLATHKEADARFRREAQLGVLLLHPNCVPILDYGTMADDSFYVVMEVVGGESLGDVIDREGRLPWKRALHIARHVLKGLEYAHGESIVHRDIKPDNIILTARDGDADFARILDFGIAKLFGAASGQALTQTGITIGTPSYLSPEQAVGGAIDGRSDLYSLSIVLYEMLTGRTPFGELEPMKRLMAHASQPVPRIDPDLGVPPDVEALVLAGLAKKPDERIPSATEYLRRIDTLFEPEPRLELAPRPKPPPVPPPVPQRRPPPRRRPLRAILAASAALVFVGAIGAVLWHPWRADAQVATQLEPAPSPELIDALAELDLGKTCKLRRNAVARLQALGDPRAIPYLERARTRVRDGKNTNACLKAAAEAAITLLSPHD